MKKILFFLLFSGILSYNGAAGAEDKIRIAVVDFSATDMPQEKGKEISAILRKEMAKTDFLEIPSREEVDTAFEKRDTLYKVQMVQSDCINLTCAAKVARELKADKTVIGTVVPEEGLFFLNASIVDLASWDIEFVASEFCEKEADISQTALKLADKIVRWLPKPGESREEAKARRIEEEKKDEIEFEKRRKAKLAKLQERKKGTCPEGMALIPGGEYVSGSPAGDPLRYKGERENKKIHLDEFCIDIYEYPNKPGEKPKKRVEWYGAKDICEKQGKRLCTDNEWEKACKGPENLAYPYGNQYDPNKCNTESGKYSLIGTRKECVSGYGVYDMSGNMKEWMASEQLGAYLNMRGGAYDTKDRESRCASFRRVIPFGSKSEYGFRCCK
jgi:formylglycine-generating enzyme required for sulfatase activity